MKFLPYRELAPTYTVAEAAAMLEITTDVFWIECFQRGIQPEINIDGVAEVDKHSICCIHNSLYYANKM